MITDKQEKQELFENKKELLSPVEVCELLGVRPKTVYDWKYRRLINGTPDGLFVKFNRKLFVRTDILRAWITSQNNYSR